MDAMYEARQDATDVDDGRAGGLTGFVADKVRNGAQKTVKKVKQTMDGAWKAVKETTGKVKEDVIDDGDHINKDPVVFEAKKIAEPIDTLEYRSIDEFRRKADEQGRV